MSMATFATLWTLGTIGLWVVTYLLNRKVNEFEEYEFNNRNSSGAVEFNSYKESKSFRAAQHRWTYLRQVAGTLAAIGTVLLFTGYMISK